jgi:hypothetical protein
LTTLRLLLLLVLLASPMARADWQQEIAPALLAGQGQYRFLGIKVYSAELWVSHKPFSMQQPFALNLTYHHHLSKSRLIAISLEEIQRIQGSSLPPEKIFAWSAALDKALKDIEAGDRMTGVNLPGVGIRFYRNARMTTLIRDVDFANAFFAIWLNAKTREPGLRSQLIGDEK